MSVMMIRRPGPLVSPMTCHDCRRGIVAAHWSQLRNWRVFQVDERTPLSSEIARAAGSPSGSGRRSPSPAADRPPAWPTRRRRARSSTGSPAAPAVDTGQNRLHDRALTFGSLMSSMYWLTPIRPSARLQICTTVVIAVSRHRSGYRHRLAAAPGAAEQEPGDEASHIQCPRRWC